MKPSLSNRIVKVRPFRLTSILIAVLVVIVVFHVVSVSVEPAIRLFVIQQVVAAFGS